MFLNHFYKHLSLFLLITLAITLHGQDAPKVVSTDQNISDVGHETTVDPGTNQVLLDSPMLKTSTFTVDSFADTPDALPGDGLAQDSSGATTLRAAIMEANALAGTDQLVLSAGTYTLDLAGRLEDLAATGDLDITDDLIISGPGAHLTTLDAAGLDRLFHVHSGVTFQLTGVSLTGGDTGTTGTSVQLSGGALANEGQATLTGVAFFQNHAEEPGGAIHNTGTLTMTRGTLDGNTATDGGALANNGTATLTNITLSGNTATVRGGGVFNDATVTTTNITVTANTGGEGGGIFNAVGGSATLGNSIIAANTAGTNADLSGQFTSNGGNLVGNVGNATGLTHGTSGDLVGDDLNPIDPLLHPLSNYGGTTLSHRLQQGSPAIDVALATGAPGDDQRGSARPQDGNGDGTSAVDMGSLEFVDGLILATPNGGETLLVNEVYSVTWFSSDLSQNVDLDVTYDDGVNWQNLATGLSAQGAFDWYPDTPAADATLRVSRTNDNTIFDTSDSSFTIPTPNLEITSPNGGEILLPGETASITWLQEYVTGNVDLKLSRDNGQSWETLVNQYTGTQFDWTVAGSGTDDAIIRIFSNGVTGLKDTTDAVFSIATPVLQVLSPNGGENLIPGSTHTITWDAQDFAGDVNIKLSLDGGSSWQTIANNVTGTSYAWTVPNDPTVNGIVRVDSNAVGPLKDNSDAPFTIATPNFQITSPNGGEVLLHGQDIAITWNQENVFGDVDLSLSRDNGQTWESLVDNFTGTSFTWTVAGPITEQAVIRMDSNRVTGLKDFTDAPFSIRIPSLQLTSPNGGETLVPGSTATVTWDAQNLSDFDLKLSLNGGSTWQTIASQATGTSLAWTVPNLPTTNGILQIISNEVDLSDNSDATFTIAAPNLAITSPNGGETWLPGEVVTITWAQDNVPGDVDLSLSRNNGQNWESLADQYTGTSFDWTVAGDATDQAILRLNSNAVTGLKDFTDSVFSIADPVLQITSPNGGESLEPGTTHLITWDAQNFAGDMDLKLSLDGGDTWQTIANGITGTEYSWTVPFQPTSNAIVRIYSNSVAGLNDSSDAAFNIGTPTIKILSPNGGESYLPWQVVTVTWDQGNIPGAVNLSLSRDGGVNWESLATDYVGTSFDWTVTGLYTNQALLHVASTTVAGVEDSSDGFFSLGDAYDTNNNPVNGDNLDREINPFNTDSDGLGLIENAPYVRINEFTGKVNAELGQIGVPGLSITPRYKLPGRPGPGWDNSLENYGALGVGWHLGYGMLAVDEGEKESKNWETVRHYDGGGNMTQFTRDYLFQRFPGNDPRALHNSTTQFYPDEHYVPSGCPTHPVCGDSYHRTRIRDVHFIDEDLRRLTRQSTGNDPDAATEFYHLMELNGAKVKYAPAFILNPHANDPKLFVPVEITEPNGRVMTLAYKRFNEWAAPANTVPSMYVESITDHDGRQLIFKYDLQDGAGTAVNTPDANEHRRYVTSVEFDGFPLATFSYQSEPVGFTGGGLHLEAMETRTGYRTEIGLDPDVLVNQRYPYLQSITSPQGGEVYLDYALVEIEVNVVERCRVNTNPDPGGEGEGDCDPVISGRPDLHRVSLLRHGGGEYTFQYEQITTGDQVAYYEDPNDTHYSIGNWDPFKVTVTLTGATQGYAYSRETYYAMEPVNLHTLSFVSRIVGQPLVRTETYVDGVSGAQTTKRGEWRYTEVAERNELRIGGTRSQGYTNIPIQVADYRFKKDGQWIVTAFDYDWRVSLQGVQGSKFLAPITSDRYILDQNHQSDGKVIRRTFDYDNSWINSVESYVLGTQTTGFSLSTDIAHDQPYFPILKSRGQEAYYPNGLAGSFELLGKVEVDYLTATPLMACKRVYTSEDESINTTYEYYQSGGPNHGLPRYVARGVAYTNGVCTPAADSDYKTTFSNYEFGMAKSIVRPEGPPMTNILNPDGTVKEETSSGKTTVYTYDLERRVTKMESGVGTGASFTPNSDPVFTEYDEPDASGQGNGWFLSYQAQNNTTAPKYKWSKQLFDTWGRTTQKLTAITTDGATTDPDLLPCSQGTDLDASGNIIACFNTHYAPIGIIEGTTDARGTDTSYAYDVFGRTVQKEVKSATNEGLTYITTAFQLDADGTKTTTNTISETSGGTFLNKVTQWDFLGRTTKAGLSQNGAPLEYTEFGYTTEQLDNNTVWKKTIKPYGQEQRATWENLIGQILQEENPEEDALPGSTATAKYTYDTRGLVIEELMAETHYATIYDDAGRQTSWGIADATTTGGILTELESYEYDNVNGQMNRATNFSGVISETLFDTFQRPKDLVITIPGVSNGPTASSLVPQGIQTVENTTPLSDINLSWAAVTGADTYQVEFFANGAPIWAAYDLTTTSVTLPLSTDTNLSIVTVGETYTWRVRSISDTGEPTLWTTATITFSETTPNGPVLAVVPGEQLNFFENTIGNTETLTLSITNGGQMDLVGTAQVVNILGTAFALEGDGEILIPAGGTITHEMAVTFTPDQVGDYAGTVQFDTNGGQLDVQLTGEGVENLPPVLATTHSSIDFDERAPGDDYLQTLRISNQGGADLIGTISVVNTSLNGFSLNSGSTISLPSGAEQDVTVKFHPDRSGDFVGYIQIATNDPNGDLIIPLTGVGSGTGASMFIPPASYSLDFGTVVRGESASFVGVGVRIYNKGNDPTSVIELDESNFSFTGSAFRIDPYNGDGVPCTVPHVSSMGKNDCWIRIRFDAPIDGPSSYSETLTIDPGPGNGGKVTINLTAQTEDHLTILSMADDATNTPIYDYMWERFYYNVPANSEKQFRITNTTNEQVDVHMRTKWPFVTCLDAGCGNQHVGRTLNPGASSVFSIYADPAENDGHDEYYELMNIEVVRSSDQTVLQERTVPLALIPETPLFRDFFSIHDNSPSFSPGYLGRDATKEITILWNAHDITIADELKMVYEGDMSGAYPTTINYHANSPLTRDEVLNFPVNKLGPLSGSIRYEAYLQGSLLATKTIDYTATGYEHFSILSIPDGNFTGGETKFFTVKNRNTTKELYLDVVLPPHFLARVKVDNNPEPFSRNELSVHFPPDNGSNSQKVIEVKFDPTYGGTFSGLVSFQPRKGNDIMPGTVELPVIGVSTQPLGSELKLRVAENVFRDISVLNVGEVSQDSVFSATVEYQNFGVTTLSGTFAVSENAAGMLSVYPTTFSINPGETKTLNVQLNPPADALTGQLHSPSFSVNAIVGGASLAALSLEGEIIETPNKVRFLHPDVGEYRNEFVIDIRDMNPGESRTVNMTYKNTDPVGHYTLHSTSNTTLGSSQGAYNILFPTGYDGVGPVQVNITLPADYDTSQPNVEAFELVSFGGTSTFVGTLLYPYTMPITRTPNPEPTATTQTSQASGNATITLAYDPNTGYLESMTSPSGNRQAYGYSTGGGLLNVAYGDSSATTTIFEVAQLDAKGTVTKQNYLSAFGNQGATSQYQYDGLGRLTSLSLVAGPTVHHNAHSIDYNEWGYVSSYTRDDVFMDDYSVAYAYTNQGQLAAHTITDNQTATDHRVDYVYDGGLADNFGNLTHHDSLDVDLDRNPATTEDRLFLPELAEGSITYNDKNRIAGYLYDGNGRLTADDKYRYEYDAAGRLFLITQKVPDATRGPVVGHYLYDVHGNRVRVLDDAELTYYYRNDGVVSETTDNLESGETTVVEHVLFGGDEVMMVTDTDGSVEYEYQYTDRMDNPAVRWTGSDYIYQEYAPYGQQMSESGTHEGAYGFTGHEDDASGLTYMSARYYTSELGRFTKPDPARDFNSLKPFSYNLYLYGSANPVNFTDPTGLEDVLDTTEDESAKNNAEQESQNEDQNESQEQSNEEQKDEEEEGEEEEDGDIFIVRWAKWVEQTRFAKYWDERIRKSGEEARLQFEKEYAEAKKENPSLSREEFRASRGEYAAGLGGLVPVVGKSKWFDVPADVLEDRIRKKIVKENAKRKAKKEAAENAGKPGRKASKAKKNQRKNSQKGKKANRQGKKKKRN